MYEGQTADQPTQRIIQPIYDAKGWMNFLGILSIIQGVIAALTIVGLIFAWLPIWVGVLIRQSAKKAEEAYLVGTEADAVESLTKIKTLFTIYGVMSIVGLIFMVLYFALIIALISGGGFEDFLEALA